jgi:hypothetical protein
VEMRTLFRWVELPSATLPGHYLLRMNWGKLAMRSPTHLPMREVLGRKMAMFHVKHRHFLSVFLLYGRAQSVAVLLEIGAGESVLGWAGHN